MEKDKHNSYKAPMVGKSLTCEEILPAIMNASNDGIFTIVPSRNTFKISRTNLSMEKTLPNIAIGKTINQVLPTQDARWLCGKIKSVLRTGKSATHTIQTSVFYGKDKLINLTLTPVKKGTTWNVIGTIRDIPKIVLSPQQKANKDRFSLALEYAPYGVCFVGKNNKPSMVNQSLGRLLNKSLSSLRETNVEDFIFADDKAVFAQALRKVKNKGYKYSDIEVRLATIKSSPVWASISMAKVDEGEDRSYFIIQFNDISKRKKLEESLVKQATRDHLTSLSNRMVFDDALRLALKNSRRYKRKGAVLYIDLDEFKQINDTYGHKAGDSALKAVGKTLKAYLRETDIIARIGGDEFAVILDEADKESVIKKAELVETAVNQICVMAHNKEVKVGCSVGYYVFDGSEALSIDDVIAKADAAMYKSKTSKCREEKQRIQLVG